MGYDKAIIIGAIQTSDAKPGKIYRLVPENIGVCMPSAPTVSTSSPLWNWVKNCVALPKEIIVFSIEAGTTNTHREECTSGVSAAIPLCVDLRLWELGKGIQADCTRCKVKTS